MRQEQLSTGIAATVVDEISTFKAALVRFQNFTDMVLHASIKLGILDDGMRAELAELVFLGQLVKQVYDQASPSLFDTSSVLHYIMNPLAIPVDEHNWNPTMRRAVAILKQIDPSVFLSYQQKIRAGIGKNTES